MTQPSAVQDAVDAGMKQQLIVLHQRLAAGMPRFGWKIGFNDPAALQRLGLSRPAVGFLDGTRVLRSGDHFTVAAGSRPRLEAEVCVRLGSALEGDADLAAARSCIASIAPAFEIVDFARASPSLQEILAGNILHEATVLAEELSPDAYQRLAADQPRVYRGGEQVATASAGRMPADLAELVILTATTLARYGERLEAGDRIICGSYITPFDIAPGDELFADFGPLGELRLVMQS